MLESLVHMMLIVNVKLLKSHEVLHDPHCEAILQLWLLT